MLCEQIPELEIVKAFNSPEIFLAEIDKLDFDLCILDIEMPQMSGLQVANLLKGKPFIFTTAYKEYAAEAFDIDAVDYVRKPVQKERLHQAVLKAFQKINQGKTSKTYFQINTEKGKALVYFDQIRYIKSADSDSRDKTAMLSDGAMLTLKNISFDKLQELLPAEDFCRINKKEMIAIKAVNFFSFDEITTNLLDKSGQFIILSLSEVYRNELVNKIKA